jgi:hypothetical protein
MWANDPKMAAKWEKKEKKMKREMKVRELIKKMVREELAGLDEATKRDYKAEYKKFQSSDKSKKYRAELNKYNRQKGTYGNGDGKDASHKGGKIVGFEKESVNRGRAEKSRLKKEGKLTEVSAGVNVWYFYKKANKDKNKFFKMLSDFRKKHSDTKWMKMLNYSLDDFNENPKKYKTIDDKQNKLFKNLQNNKKVREGKLTEDFKNNEWEVYVADENRREKIVKVAKSKRAAVILYNKLIKTDKYHEVGMRVIKEGKLTESQQVAKTILQQLGGNKFIAMTGAKNFGSSKNSLQFKIGRNSKSISHVIITLKSSDLYDVEFIRMRGTSRKVVKKLKGVYADMLQKIFTKYTGMNTRL